ncbi:MAG: elongation factor G [Candidatus Howiella sp.]
MKHHSADKIKNIALLGHGGSGKSTLADALLFSAGLVERIGKNADGSLTMDFDPEEKRRKVSVSTAVYPVEYGDKKLNLIDAPGLFDFAGGVSEALAAADSALIVLSGKSGLSVGAELAYINAKKAAKPIAFFIGKLDSAHANYRKVLSTLTGKYGPEICPVVMPIMQGEQVDCYIDLIHEAAFRYTEGKATPCPLPDSEDIANLRSLMLESLASADEALMEKYFDGAAFTEEEILTGLQKGMAGGELCPVFCGAGQTGAGTDLLLDILSKIAPAADSAAVAAERGEELIELKADENGPLAAFVFKTIADPFVGKLSYFKVVSGRLKSDSKIVNARTGAEERIAKVMLVKGGKQEDADYIGAGDIGSAAKLGSLLTGDTVCAPGDSLIIPPASYPAPCLSMAVTARKKGDEEKMAAGLLRLCEEDPTLKFETNHETHEQILSGLGEQHIDVAISKLKAKFGVEVDLAQPKVAYRETIRKKVKVQGRHKKQSGGHGQFGDVWIEFEPCDADDLVFEEKVFGGAVPKNFFPAVEKGLRDCVVKGVLAGYPMVGVKATLVDGSYHPVDSSEMSFKMAAALAYKAGIPDASPVLLEPIGTLRVLAPDDNMGDVIGDINKRRGRVLGMNPADNQMQEIIAEVPMGEMGDFATAMRSITQGRASFTLDFARYEEAPPMVAQKVIAAAKAEA